MKTKKLFSYCTILRRKLVSHGTLNLITGEQKIDSAEIVVEPCGVPLFKDDEMKVGVCKGCREGWEVSGNTFADKDEEIKALELSGAPLQ